MAADTFTTHLGLRNQGVGNNENTWGTLLNTDVFDLLDLAIADYRSKSVAGAADVTLTTTEALSATIELTGAITASINVIVPTKEKNWAIYNNTSGAFTVTVKTSAGTGIVVPQGRKMDLTCDGTNVVGAANNFATLTVGALVPQAIGAQTSGFQVIGAAAATSSASIGRWAADATGPTLNFAKSRNATPGSFTIVQNNDVLGTIGFYADDGGDYVTPAATIHAIVNGTPGANDMPGALIFSTTADGAATVTEVMRLNSAGAMYINDTSNAGMTIGLTITQGANDDEAFAIKSSDVAHARTGVAETDTYGFMRKTTAAEGGLEIVSMHENTAGGYNMRFVGHGGQGDTTQSATSRSLAEFYLLQHDGAGAAAAVAAASNVFGIKAFTGGADRTVFIVNEDGSLFVDTTATITVFDQHDDARLARGYDLARNSAAVIRTEFDRFVGDRLEELTAAGIFGRRSAEQIAAGDAPMWNVTQHVRLLNGAVWQGRVMYETLIEAIDEHLPGLTDEMQSRLGHRGLPSLMMAERP